jgi:ATP-dependent DNA helicase RecG
MRPLMQPHDLVPPTFESASRPDQLVATFLIDHFLGPDDLARLRTRTAEALSDEEARALVFVRELGAINNAAYRHINGADTLNASAHLRRLRDLSLLAMKGSGSQTYYVAGEAFKRAASATISTGRVGADTPQAIGQIHTSPPANTHQAPPNTHQVGPNTPQVTVQTAAQTLPEALRERLPMPGTKPRRKAIQRLLIDLCAWKPLSARELAMLLGRKDPKHLVRELLSPMVADGLLAYTIPAMEKHPEQRYVAPGTAAGDSPVRPPDK